MKNFFITLFSLLSLQASADIVEDVVIDFSDPDVLNINPAFTLNERLNLTSAGDIAIITDRTISQGLLTLSFSTGDSREGVAINHAVQVDEQTGDTLTSLYSLAIRKRATMTIEGTECKLLSVTFDGDIGSLSSKDLGSMNSITKTWTPDGATTSTVTFKNGANSDTRIYRIKVTYSRQAMPLVLQHSTPAAGAEVKSFKSMTLQFNTSVVDTVTTSGIQLERVGQDPRRMNVVFTNNIVTLSLDNPLSSSSNYTVKVPSGSFVNEEGAVNSDISISFKARIPLVYESVDPDPFVKHPTLSDTIRLTYPQKQSIVIADDAYGMLFRGEEDLGLVEVSKEESSSNVVILHLPTGKITEEGVYSVFIPEGTIHNNYYKRVADNDSWNEQFTLTYTVEIPVLPEMVSAKELIQNEGIGYPATDSESRLALETVIAKGEEATAEELTEAMGAFYNETDVEMPADSTWYHIVGVNNADKPSMVYLSYVDGSVRLTSDAAQASPFQAIAKDGAFVFRTPDKKHFLHVLTNREDLTKMSAANVTDDETFVNYLTVSKLAMAEVDSTLTFGKLSITGVVLSLQMEDDDMVLHRDTMTMAIDHAATRIVDSEKDVLYFDEQFSSAFTFEAADAPFDPDLYVYPVVGIGSDGVIMEGETLTLAIGNVKTATLANPEYPYLMKNGERLEVEGDVLTATEVSNVFLVNTATLPVGSYVIVLPLGTFTYEKIDKEVMDAEMTVSFVVKEFVVPEPEFRYTYNGQFSYLQELLRIQQGRDIVPDIDLNEFVLFANVGNPYSGMVPDETKIVEVQNYYTGKALRKGHFVPYPEIEEDYPEFNLFNVQAIKLVLDEPFNFGDIRDAITAAYVIPRGTFGDANFGQWLQNHNSVSPGECIVNDLIEVTVLVNNQFYQGINNVFNQSADNTFYDLQGRKVSEPTTHGVYIMNGKKRVVK